MVQTEGRKRQMPSGAGRVLLLVVHPRHRPAEHFDRQRLLYLPLGVLDESRRRRRHALNVLRPQFLEKLREQPKGRRMGLPLDSRFNVHRNYQSRCTHPRQRIGDHLRAQAAAPVPDIPRVHVTEADLLAAAGGCIQASTT